MSKIHEAIREIQTLDELSARDVGVNRLHPVSKLLVTLIFIIVTVSFPKYRLSALLGMILYPLVLFTAADLSFKDALRRLKVVLPLVCIVGVFNPFFDRAAAVTIGGIAVSGGVLSMLTLMVKAVLTVLASYLLVATTGMDAICQAMRMLHVPQILVVEMQLIYRYIQVFLMEAHRVTLAYSLRAPGQKGIAFSAWGSLLGQMLLRSMDRAGRVYESMCLRGFDGSFAFAGEKRMRPADWLYLVIWAVVLAVLRWVPVTEMIGKVFM